MKVQIVIIAALWLVTAASVEIEDVKAFTLPAKGKAQTGLHKTLAAPSFGQIKIDKQPAIYKSMGPKGLHVAFESDDQERPIKSGKPKGEANEAGVLDKRGRLPSLPANAKVPSFVSRRRHFGRHKLDHDSQKSTSRSESSASSKRSKKRGEQKNRRRRFSKSSQRKRNARNQKPRLESSQPLTPQASPKGLSILASALDSGNGSRNATATNHSLVANCTQPSHHNNISSSENLPPKENITHTKFILKIGSALHSEPDAQPGPSNHSNHSAHPAQQPAINQTHVAQNHSHSANSQSPQSSSAASQPEHNLAASHSGHISTPEVLRPEHRTSAAATAILPDFVEQRPLPPQTYVSHATAAPAHANQPAGSPLLAAPQHSQQNLKKEPSRKSVKTVEQAHPAGPHHPVEKSEGAARQVSKKEEKRAEASNSKKEAKKDRSAKVSIKPPVHSPAQESTNGQHHVAGQGSAAHNDNSKPELKPSVEAKTTTSSNSQEKEVGAPREHPAAQIKEAPAEAPKVGVQLGSRLMARDRSFSDGRRKDQHSRFGRAGSKKAARINHSQRRHKN